jgi:hypothetical protein
MVGRLGQSGGAVGVSSAEGRTEGAEQEMNMARDTRPAGRPAAQRRRPRKKDAPGFMRIIRPSRVIPALFTSTSTVPHLSVVAFTSASSSSRLLTSARTAMASPPRAAASAATSSALAAEEA